MQQYQPPQLQREQMSAALKRSSPWEASSRVPNNRQIEIRHRSDSGILEDETAVKNFVYEDCLSLVDRRRLEVGLKKLDAKDWQEKEGCVMDETEDRLEG